MKIVITGALGFLGCNLTAYWLGEGHEVVAVDRLEPREDQRLNGGRYIVCDLSDSAAMKLLVRNADVVVHLASTVTPATSNINICKDVAENLSTTLSLFELCAKAGVRRVLFPSSGGTVYGIPTELPIQETHPTEPICSYGIVKLAEEKYLHLFYRLYGLEYRVLRISNPYGPYQNIRNAQGAIGTFLWKVLRNEQIDIWGDGSVIRDYLYVDDVTRAFNAALTSSEDVPKVLNIGSGIGYSLNEVLLCIRDTLSLHPNVRYLPSRNMDVPANILDPSIAEVALGWRARWSLAEGILATAEHMRR